MKPKTPRTSMKEIRLIEYVNGFFDCLNLFEEAWRKEVLKNGIKGSLEASEEPIPTFLFEVIQRAQKHVSQKHDAYHDLRAKRLSEGSKSPIEELAAQTRGFDSGK